MFHENRSNILRSEGGGTAYPYLEHWNNTQKLNITQKKPEELKNPFQNNVYLQFLPKCKIFRFLNDYISKNKNCKIDV